MTLPCLRQATAARHAAIESRSVLLDPGLSRATYCACLRRFFGYCAPLERRLLRSREALRAIRSDPALEALPLVVLSGSANPRDLQFCHRQGANAYHVKPVDHAAHLRVLQQIFACRLGSVVLPA